MKLSKVLYLVLFIIFIVILFPNIVNAETLLEDVSIYLENEPVLNGIPDKTVIAVSAHSNGGELKIQWYESTDGINYVKMTTEQFDYFKFYRFELIEPISMDEGWECGHYSINGEGGFRNTNEKVYGKFMKYYIESHLGDEIQLIGPEFVEDDEDYLGIIKVVKEGYRLPIQLSVMSSSYNEFIVVQRDSGEIRIDKENITSDIYIYGEGRKITYYDYIDGNNSEYILNSNNSLEFVIDADLNELYKHSDNIVDPRYGESYLKSRVFLNDIELGEYADFEVDKDSNKIILLSKFLNTLDVNEYKLRVELKDGDAITSFTVNDFVKVITEFTEVKSDNNSSTTLLKKDYITNLKANDGYKLPEKVYILINGNELDFDKFKYDSSTGYLYIPREYVTGNIYIVCNAEKIINNDKENNNTINNNTINNNIVNSLEKDIVNNDIKDETPKTGDYTIIAVKMITLISLACLVIIK